MDDVSYETCQYCNRKFFEGKLKMHQKLCTPQKPLKFVAKIKQKRSKSIHQQKTERNVNKNSSLDRSYVASAECSVCGKKFNPRNLEHHIELCQKSYQELLFKKLMLEKQLKTKKLMYNCKSCNYDMELEHNFCGRCGAKKGG